MKARNALASAIGAIWLVLAMGSVAAAANIQNPSFEAGDLSGWTHTGFANVTKASGSNATDGNYYAISNPSVINQIKQSFTVPAGIDKVSFDASFMLVGGEFDARMSLVGQESNNYINLMGFGSTYQYLGDYGTPGNHYYWSRYTQGIAQFAGQDVTLWFYVSTSPSNPNVLIDNIQLIAPEPATLAVLLLGAVCILRRRRPGPLPIM